MIALVATRIPRKPVRDVDGAMVRALRFSLGLSLMDFGSRVGKEKVTVYRWEIGGIDEIMWLGLLSRLGLPSDWTAPVDILEEAQAEIRELRMAAAKRKSVR